jgi:phosphoenolpyruvate carboxykinase (ATP)
VLETGLRNGAFGADKFGLKNLKTVHWNLGAPQLYQYSLAAGEAVLSADGALCADTGEFTGRSPKDKFTVRDATTDKNMWWAGNQSISADQFSALYADFLKHAEGMTLYAQDLYGGADPTFQIKTRVFTELAWHSLFIRTLLIRPEASTLRDFVPELTIIDLPSFRADPKRHGVRSENVVAIDFARKIVLIGGSYYAGEMKKSVFTTLNYYLPAKGVLPPSASSCRRRPNRRSSPPATASARCWKTSCSTRTPAFRISMTARRPRTPVRPIRWTSSRMLRAPAAPASRRTS